MVINIWRYMGAQEGLVGPRLKESLAFSTALSRARYIFDIQLTPEDVTVLERIKPVGDYIDNSKGTAHRIEGRYAYNLASEDPEERSQEIALYGARGGLERFWHIAVSSRKGHELDSDELEHARKVVLRVLGVADCPSVWAEHGDTDNQHMHGLVVSYLPSEDRSVTFGQDWWKEASQIAAAIVERDLDLDPEPNHRLVADHTGVYDRISDTKVADEQGRILGRARIVAMQKHQRAWKNSNYAPTKELASAERDLEDVIRTLAEPRIKDANNAQDMHERLARVGLRYIADKNGARVIANGYRQGTGKDSLGQGIAASKVYANAGLKKLSSRFKKSGGYQPAATTLRVRRFVMPRYNKLDDRGRQQYADTSLAHEEGEALIGHLSKDNANQYRLSRDSEKGRQVNSSRATRKREHQLELDAAKALRDSLPNMTRSGQPIAATKTAADGLAMLWGPKASRGWEKRQKEKDAERAEIDKRYEIDRDNAQRYFLYGELAFIVRRRTIEIFSRKRRVQIDAMRIARLLFKEVRIAARHTLRVRFAKIAAELDAAMGEPIMRRIGEVHRDGLAAGRSPGIVAAAKLFEASKGERRRMREADKAAAPKSQTRRSDRDDERIVNSDPLFVDYDRAVAEAQSDADNTPFADAWKKLEEHVDHDLLQLSASRYRQTHNGRTVRYLDAPSLLEQFGDDRAMLVDGYIQRDLEAIEAIHREKRRWIASAIVAGEASIEDGRLQLKVPNQDWARHFWDGQGGDPRFRRLIAVARARPELFPFDPSANQRDTAMAIARTERPYLVEAIRRLGHAQARRSYAKIADAKRERPILSPRPSSQPAPSEGRAHESLSKAASHNRTKRRETERTRRKGVPFPSDPGLEI